MVWKRGTTWIIFWGQPPLSREINQQLSSKRIGKLQSHRETTAWKRWKPGYLDHAPKDNKSDLQEQDGNYAALQDNHGLDKENQLKFFSRTTYPLRRRFSTLPLEKDRKSVSPQANHGPERGSSLDKNTQLSPVQRKNQGILGKDGVCVWPQGSCGLKGGNSLKTIPGQTNHQREIKPQQTRTRITKARKNHHPHRKIQPTKESSSNTQTIPIWNKQLPWWKRPKRYPPTPHPHHHIY